MLHRRDDDVTQCMYRRAVFVIKLIVRECWHLDRPKTNHTSLHILYIYICAFALFGGSVVFVVARITTKMVLVPNTQDLSNHARARSVNTAMDKMCGRWSQLNVFSNDANKSEYIIYIRRSARSIWGCRCVYCRSSSEGARGERWRGRAQSKSIHDRRVEMVDFFPSIFEWRLILGPFRVMAHQQRIYMVRRSNREFDELIAIAEHGRSLNSNWYTQCIGFGAQSNF